MAEKKTPAATIHGPRRRLSRPSKRFNIPGPLLDAVRHRKLIPLVGAGISRQAIRSDEEAFPEWSKLLKGLNKEAYHQNRLDRETLLQIDELIDNGDWLVAAEVLREKAKGTFWHYIERKLNPNDAKPARIHEAILRLNPPVVLTTNFDKLLELAFSHLYGSPPTTYVYGDSEEAHGYLRAINRLTKPLIFKMHGCIDKSREIIFTESDYRKVIYREPGYRTLLSAIFVNYTVLMLGFSLRDRDLRLLLEALQEAFDYSKREDYILLPSPSGEKSLEMGHLEDSFNMQTITYVPSDGQPEVFDFVNQLIRESGVMKPASVRRLILSLDDYLARTGKRHLTPSEANGLLADEGLLHDDPRHPGEPMRKLLRAGKIRHAYKRGSRWLIPHS